MTKQNKQYPTFMDFRKGEEGKPAFGVVLGNVTRDVELRKTGTGKSVANVGLAVNLGAKHLNYVLGTSFANDETIFIEVTGWEQTADIMQKANVSKGSQVAFTGSLALEEYEGKQRVRLNVSKFQITRRKGDSQVAGTQNQSSIESEGQPIDISDDDLPF